MYGPLAYPDFQESVQNTIAKTILLMSFSDIVEETYRLEIAKISPRAHHPSKKMAIESENWELSQMVMNNVLSSTKRMNTQPAEARHSSR